MVLHLRDDVARDPVLIGAPADTGFGRPVEVFCRLEYGPDILSGLSPRQGIYARETISVV